MIVARTRVGLQEALTHLRRDGASVGLVPTMGFLHAGHLSLVDRAKALSSAVATSIFVNPLQFGPAEDLEAYPRDEARDLSLLEERGTDLVFVPSVEEMYPGGDPLVTVSPGFMGDRLCGAHRPGHFAGVLTVVAKLFGLFRPDTAVFGRKDFQQYVLIRRMVTDLDLSVRVDAAPIVREADGLAMSSRNAYLTPEERTDANGLVEGLRAAAKAFTEGEVGTDALLAHVRGEINRREQLRLQYAALVNADTLEGLSEARTGAVIAVAAHCGTTRLIDNLELP